MLTTKQLSNGVTVCAVTVPEGAKQFSIHYTLSVSLSCLYWRDGKPKAHIQKLPFGKWQQVGASTADKLSEEECTPLAEEIKFGNAILYNNYIASSRDFRDIVEAAFKTRKESLLSLLKAMGKDPNTTVLLIQQVNK